MGLSGFNACILFCYFSSPENYLLILSDSLQDEFAATTKDPCTSSLAFQPVMPVIPPSTIDVMDDSDLCQESIIIENDIRYGFPKTTADKSSSTLQTGMPVITPILHQLMQWLLHTHVNKLQLKMPFYVHFQHSYHNNYYVFPATSKDPLYILFNICNVWYTTFTDELFNDKPRDYI